MPHPISGARKIVKYASLIVGSILVGGVVSAVTGILAQSFLNNSLLEWKSLGLLGAIIGCVMGFCSVMKIEGLGSFMTDQVGVIRYKEKIVKANWFDYMFFFSALVLFVINVWAYNPAMESGTFLSDILSLALALGGVIVICISIHMLSRQLVTKY
jgi:hypothetical protein